jgi:hypothetical protein
LVALRDQHTLASFNPLRWCRFTEGDEWVVIWAECKERAGSGDEPYKGGLVVQVITLTCHRGEDVLEAKTRLEKYEGGRSSGRFDYIKHGHA